MKELLHEHLGRTLNFIFFLKYFLNVLPHQNAHVTKQQILIYLTKKNSCRKTQLLKLFSKLRNTA